MWCLGNIAHDCFANASFWLIFAAFPGAVVTNVTVHKPVHFSFGRAMNTSDDFENLKVLEGLKETTERKPISTQRKIVRVIWVAAVSYGGAAMFGMFGLLMLAFSSDAASGKGAAQMVTLAMTIAVAGLFIVAHIPIIAVLLNWSFESVVGSFIISGILGAASFITGFVMIVMAVSK